MVGLISEPAPAKKWHDAVEPAEHGSMGEDCREPSDSYTTEIGDWPLPISLDSICYAVPCVATKYVWWRRTTWCINIADVDISQL
ncbi:unnamed protein product [Sphenostylis stenocarpa]|uniref:Uncharacterized protein n=1 Tax=Sphenostylis stenocarpa TaxID=92480 RepID=A0AA86VZE0_9FABA|nr:unnamed protein product [Sphenostylis stenocarpa]